VTLAGRDVRLPDLMRGLTSLVAGPEPGVASWRSPAPDRRVLTPEAGWAAGPRALVLTPRPGR